MKQSKGKKGGAKATKKPILLIMMGFPGSGKSTCSKRIGDACGVSIGARDDLGSTDAVKSVLEKQLRHSNHVIVDCVNVHPKDRIMWTTMARAVCPDVRVVLFFLDTPLETCVARCEGRKNHPTLSPENGREVVESFARGFKHPETWELGKMGKYLAMLRATPDNVDDVVKEAIALLNADE